jgi:hypothetical protein
MGWEDALRAEVDEKSDEEVIVFAGEVITRMTRTLLPEMGDARRQAAVRIIESGSRTYTELAESIGARPGTIQRLVEEGRRRERIGREAPAAA